MNKIATLVVMLLVCFNLFGQTEAVWDQGVPLCPDNAYITNLTDKLDLINIRDGKSFDEKTRLTCREIGLAFYDGGEYDAADWYLKKSKDFKIETVINPAPVIKEDTSIAVELESMKKDLEFLNSMPKTFDNLSKADMKNLAMQLDFKIKELIKEKDSLVKVKASEQLIESKEGAITTLKKEKTIVDLSIKNDDLVVENVDLEKQKNEIRKYLIWVSIAASLLALGVLVLFQRKTIKVQDKDIIKKNTYLDHAAKLIRHDMHSGINTYMPRGIASLEKRVSPEQVAALKIDGPLKMIKEGLAHTQRVYKSVYEFTNLVKQSSVLEKTKTDLKELLMSYLSVTSYASQVVVNDLTTAEINETLFWNAVDNIIKNGLKYNDSENKLVTIYMEKDHLVVEDNGRGFTQEQLNKALHRKDKDSGLGLAMSSSILAEHGFLLTCEKTNNGTKFKIKLK